MRLSFWYLIAEGTQGQAKAKVSQYRDGPAQRWKALDGGFDVCLNVVGQWVKVEKTFRTHDQATTLGLDFRIVGGDIGEAWIDDIVLEPLEATPLDP